MYITFYNFIYTIPLEHWKFIGSLQTLIFAFFFQLRQNFEGVNRIRLQVDSHVNPTVLEGLIGEKRYCLTCKLFSQFSAGA